jgi:uncharacterized protein YcnI
VKKTTIAVAATLGAGMLLAVGTPLMASAHVSLDENTAEAGAYTLLTFKVPNESETAKTEKIELHIPTDTPFASVSYVPTPGWDTELVTETLAAPVTVGESEITDAVTSVVWTPQESDGGIADGELQLFTISVGPVPDVDTVNLTVDQTYTDGTVVEWNGEGDEPAPVLYVNEEPATDEHAATHDESEEAEASADSTNETGDDVLARVLGIGGLVVGAVGIVLAVTARRSAAAKR